MHTPKFPSKDSVFYLDEKIVNLIPTEKRIRGYLEKRRVVSSSQARILRVSGMPVKYCFPSDDVDFSTVEEKGKHNDFIGSGIKFYRSGKEDNEPAMVKYEETPSVKGMLNNMVVINWNALDMWEEEGEQVLIHPRDPYTRIDVLRGDRSVEVWLKDTLLARTKRPLMMFETGLPVRYYIPTDDVDLNLLTPSDYTTGCPYKGRASYWNVNLNGEMFKNVVWSYMDPFDETLKVKGLMCFYTEKVDKFMVDGVDLRNNSDRK